MKYQDALAEFADLLTVAAKTMQGMPVGKKTEGTDRLLQEVLQIAERLREIGSSIQSLP